MTITKTFKLYISVNWKTGAAKLYKKPITKPGPFEIPIMFDLKVKTPEFKMIKASGEVEISEHKVNEMTAHAI